MQFIVAISDGVLSSPSVLTKNSSAEVQISLRAAVGTVAKPIPLEPFSANKDMGRILIRREGESIGAGIVLSILS